MKKSFAAVFSFSRSAGEGRDEGVVQQERRSSAADCVGHPHLTSPASGRGSYVRNLFLSLLLISCAMGLSACQELPSRNVYNEQEVGKQTDVEFGVIKAVKHVKVQQQNTGVGTLGGAAAGGVAGSTLGGGKGAVLTAIAGAIAGGVAGNAAESALDNSVGIQYIIRKENGHTVSIVQNIGKDERPLHVGQRVMIQTTGSYQEASGRGVAGAHGGQYQRVLPADDSDGQ